MERPSSSPTAPPAVHFRSDSHRNSILGKFQKLRQLELLCDVTLLVEDTPFRGHKALLAACSDFFSAMFTGDPAGGASYRLDGVRAPDFRLLLDFLYSASVSVPETRVPQLRAAARLMQVGELESWLARVEGPGPEGGGAGSVPAPDGDSAGTVSNPEGGSTRTVLVPGRRRARPKRAGARGRPSGPPPSGEEPDPEDRPGLDPRRRRRKISLPLKYQAFSVGEEPAPPRRKTAARSECEECGKVFKNHVLLRGHLMTHTGERPFGCSVCGKGFTQKHSLLVHQRIHTGEKPFACSVCAKTLATKHSLKEHMNLHAGEKAFSCDQCEKTFTQKRQLKSHYRIHTGKALPQCAQCQRSFLDSAQLKKHLRTHTGEKPFTCEICGKCFSAKTTLQTHMRIHRGEKPFQCHVCGKSFSDASARRRHVTSHSGKKPFSCSSCSLSFTRLDNLRTHALAHSKERPAAPPPAGPEVQLLVADVDLGPGQEPAPQPRPALAEPVHVLALSKEGEEPPPPHPFHLSSGQPFSISQTSQQLSSHHIQGQTFQIQAGTVSYLYTTGLPPH